DDRNVPGSAVEEGDIGISRRVAVAEKPLASRGTKHANCGGAISGPVADDGNVSRTAVVEGTVWISRCVAIAEKPLVAGRLVELSVRRAEDTNRRRNDVVGDELSLGRQIYETIRDGRVGVVLTVFRVTVARIDLQYMLFRKTATNVECLKPRPVGIRPVRAIDRVLHAATISGYICP